MYFNNWGLNSFYMNSFNPFMTANPFMYNNFNPFMSYNPFMMRNCCCNPFPSTYRFLLVTSLLNSITSSRQTQNYSNYYTNPFSNNIYTNNYYSNYSIPQTVTPQKTFDSNYYFSPQKYYYSEVPKVETSTDLTKSNATTSLNNTVKTNKTSKPSTNSTKKVLTKNEITDIACRKAKQYGVDERLVLAVIDKESSFNPNAGSKKGALGLMQLMPATAKSLGVTDRTDPEQNIDGGVRYLKKLLDRFNGNIPKALAAYNAGLGHVLDYLNGTNKCGKNPQHKVIASGIPPFKETQNYVSSIYNNYKNYSVA